MPVVITDFTNKVWAVEQPGDGYVHVGWVGQSGPRLIDVLEFLQDQQKQFDKFIQRKREAQINPNARKGKRIRKSPGVILQSDNVLPTKS